MPLISATDWCPNTFKDFSNNLAWGSFVWQFEVPTLFAVLLFLPAKMMDLRFFYFLAVCRIPRLMWFVQPNHYKIEDKAMKNSAMGKILKNLIKISTIFYFYKRFRATGSSFQFFGVANVKMRPTSMTSNRCGICTVWNDSFMIWRF